ncbi:MAG: polysaccharide deacetylase family protein [Tannerellaceae bacterium]|nr:polysaccharide deacetylase family protein [Tannerellaceae bacterium]
MKKVVFSFLMGVVCCFSPDAISQVQSSVRVAKYKGDRSCAVSYTFDDGMREHYTLVFSQLEKHHFKGTFWICGGFIEDNHGEWLTWEQVKEMAAKGHEMSNHSWSHTNLTEISPEEVATEIRKNDLALSEQTGIVPRTFCYPYNAFDQVVYELASAGRVATRTQEFGIGTASTPESLEAWIQDLLVAGEWGVAMIHGITEGYDAFPAPAVLWDHLEKVKQQEEWIWVATFCEVAAYREERDRIQLEVTENENEWTVTLYLELDKKVFDEPLTLVVEHVGHAKVTVRQGMEPVAVQRKDDRIVFDFDPYGEPVRVVFE